MFASEWSVGVFNQHFFVLAILALAYFGIAGSLFQEVKMSGSPDVKKGNTILFIVGSVVAYVLVWLALHAGLPKYPDTAAMISLGIYTVIGIASYVQGFTRNSTTLRTYGGVLIALVVARLLIVDVWQMQLTGRIITFFLIGTLLMSTAFLGRKPRTVDSSKNTP